MYVYDMHVCMYVYDMYACMYACMYVYDMYAWLYMYVSKICTHERMYVRTYVCIWVRISTYHWQFVFKNWHFDLPEDGTLVQKRVGDEPLIFIYN